MKMPTKMNEQAVFGAITGKLEETLLKVSISNFQPTTAKNPTKKTSTAKILENIFVRSRMRLSVCVFPPEADPPWADILFFIKFFQ
jgi:hypothetical protein